MAPVYSNCHFLGCVPVSKVEGEEVVKECAEILHQKLCKIHHRSIGGILEKKVGSRLSEASPVYQKTAKKLRKLGKDVTVGQLVHVELVEDALVVRGAEANSEGMSHTLDTGSITYCDYAPSFVGSEYPDKVLAFIGLDELGQNQCFLLRVPADNLRAVRTAINSAMTAERRPAGAKKKKNTKPKRSDSDSKLTVEVGLFRKSSLKVSKSMRKRNSVLLGQNQSRLSQLSTHSSNGDLEEDEDFWDDIDGDLFSSVGLDDSLDLTNKQVASTHAPPAAAAAAAAAAPVTAASTSESTSVVEETVHLSNFRFDDDEEDFGFDEAGEDDEDEEFGF